MTTPEKRDLPGPTSSSSNSTALEGGQTSFKRKSKKDEAKTREANIAKDIAAMAKRAIKVSAAATRLQDEQEACDSERAASRTSLDELQKQVNEADAADELSDSAEVDPAVAETLKRSRRAQALANLKAQIDAIEGEESLKGDPKPKNTDNQSAEKSSDANPGSTEKSKRP